MDLLDRLRQKAKKALQIFVSKVGLTRNHYGDHAVNLAHGDTPPPPETPFEFLKRTYSEIAEADPEAALKMLREEIENRPPPEIANSLIEIEKHIRASYCSQYFGGMRVRS
ncbi:MAG: hypothetical protein H6855_01870 [Rhodospirillales bacterium]|nr:hypothetical protein [Rhodospirillales bacterium]MCB9964812.1 hypothetical protein [Rhodospirillales bacterium]MCB9980481.1 hypothetical protein [Rhodospirillales bacterium]